MPLSLVSLVKLISNYAIIIIIIFNINNKIPFITKPAMKHEKKIIF